MTSTQRQCQHGFADPAACPTCQHFQAVREAESQDSKREKDTPQPEQRA